MNQSEALKSIAVTGAIRQTQNLKRYDDLDRYEIQKKLNIRLRKGQKIILFCANYYFDDDYDRVVGFLDYMSSQKDLFCIVKLHPATPMANLSDLNKKYKNSARIIQFFHFYHLLKISDIVITILRSTATIDAFICHKPVIIWDFQDKTGDNEHFMSLWDPNNPPYIRVFNQNQCERTIRFILKNPDIRKYLASCSEVVRLKLGIDGHAAKRTVDYIIKTIIKDQNKSSPEPMHAV